MQTLHKIRTGIMKVLGVLIVALFILMTVIGTYQIVTRYFFKRPSTGSARKCLEIAIDLLTFTFAGVVMVYGGVSITRLTMIQNTASLRVPMGYIYVIVPVTGALIMIFSLINAMDMLHKDFNERGEAGL